MKRYTVTIATDALLNQNMEFIESDRGGWVKYSEALDWFESLLQRKQRLCLCDKCQHCMGAKAVEIEFESLRALIAAEREE